MTELRYVPLLPGTNRPAIKDWPNRASADPLQWSAWRREMPGCNFGVLTGNGIGVIDLDTKNDPLGAGGFDTLITVEELLSVDLSNLPLVMTHSGAHLYFRYEGRLPSKVPWLPHIDVKADGGHQVAAPGTVRLVNGVERTYTLVRGDLQTIPPAPAVLLDAMRGWRIGRTGTGGSPSLGADLPSDIDAITHGLPLNSRNDFMHRLACRWWAELGLSNGDAVRSRAYRVWQATPNHDTFTWDEALAAVRSAERFMTEEIRKDLELYRAWGLNR